MIDSTLFQNLEIILREQNRAQKDIDEIKRAFNYAYKQHDGQYRVSEEPFIVHPVEVACILTDLQSDTETIIAALLHDIVEDTPITTEELTEEFGEVIANLVNGVTKLSKYQFSSKQQRQAENFRKMFLAMANDIRVILLKLADRLHNMRTLHHMTPAKQRKIAQETTEIFSPLANRLGMWKLKSELDDLCLNYLHPDEYLEIAELVSQSKKDREEAVKSSIEKIQGILNDYKVKAEVYGRAKNYYSIYRKLTTQHKTFKELYDITAVRTIVDSERECYEVLGIIHSAFKPIPGRFKDYIAMPKSNLYKSLHTTVMGSNGKPLEVQIRTTEMHQIAEYGIAAHWKYKESGGKSGGQDDLDRKFAWLRKLVEFQQDVQDAQEYVDSVKIDLFRDEVFVFTPRGDVYDLPYGAVPIDFAYRIHTEVGHTCVGALINSKMMPLNTKLQSGDIIEILTNKHSHPRLDWLNIVATTSAKGRIRGWFKKHHREEHIAQGKLLLETDLTKAKFDEAYKSGILEDIAKQLNYNGLEDLYAAIGYGEINTPKVTNRLKKDEKEIQEVLQKPRFASGKSKKSEKHIEGLQGMLYHISKCCFPLPGESIVGVITRSRGISVHREDCKSLSQVDPERIMNITWSEKSRLDKSKTYTVGFVVEVIDRIGIFKDILSKIADCKTNVTYAGVKTRHDSTALIEISADVESKEFFDGLLNSLYDISDVLNVRRQQVGTNIRPKSIKKTVKTKKHKRK